MGPSLYRHNRQTAKLAELVGEARSAPAARPAGVKLQIADAGNRALTSLSRWGLMDAVVLNQRRTCRRRAGGVYASSGNGGGERSSQGRVLQGDVLSQLTRACAPGARRARGVGERARSSRRPLELNRPGIESGPPAVGRDCSRAGDSIASSSRMSDAIRVRRSLLGRDDALGQARAIDALYRSAAEGRPVNL